MEKVALSMHRRKTSNIGRVGISDTKQKGSSMENQIESPAVKEQARCWDLVTVYSPVSSSVFLEELVPLSTVHFNPMIISDGKIRLAIRSVKLEIGMILIQFLMLIVTNICWYKSFPWNTSTTKTPLSKRGHFCPYRVSNDRQESIHPTYFYLLTVLGEWVEREIYYSPS